ncbi:Ferredoxin fas2 [Fundidesulfovibrio magnetotacticus]|uniref:Ferredoxin fas2 n=1 Tax=Fundidesulfovibrio magnetotacticus TaxID=2730080 RepID=A0A6V8LTA3_9BACT|nr:transketolase [Fundidesulfovibrio magnetotacticus]GFK94954.1 Ferredoxin fas2 [Fundidesulfovibrio magnetotacticus]
MNDMHGSARAWHEQAMGAALDARSLELRRTVVEMLARAGRGHLGSSLSLIEMLRALYDHVLRFDPARPGMPERDRCILSKGHGCLALYALLADKGFFPREELWRFCRKDALLGGHPDATKIPGVEASTGSLGHGLPIGLGMALAVRGRSPEPRVFVVLGDGECNEGSVWEACLSAGNRGVENLTLLVDYNKYQSYDATCVVQDLEPLDEKFRAFKWAVRHVNGHDVQALRQTLSGVPFEPGMPSAVICHTVKGKGIHFAENNLQWHHKSSINEEMAARMREALG